MAWDFETAPEFHQKLDGLRSCIDAERIAFQVAGRMDTVGAPPVRRD